MEQINGEPIAALIMGSQSDWETMTVSYTHLRAHETAS